MKLNFYTPCTPVPDGFGGATFGFVGAENERLENSITFPDDLNGSAFYGTYEEVLSAVTPGEWQAGIVLFGNVGNENEFIRKLQTKLNIPLVGGAAATNPETGEKGLITNRGEVNLFLISDDRFDVSVACKNIHEEVISEHEISFTNPRVIDTIDGIDGISWLREKKKEFGIPDEDFEQLTLSDKNDINAHLSYVGDKVGSGRDLTRRMLLRYIPKKDVYNKMREFYDDENAIVFGCAGLKGMLSESLNSRGTGLFMFGEVCTNNSVAEFGNLMLSKLVLKKVK